MVKTRKKKWIPVIIPWDYRKAVELIIVFFFGMPFLVLCFINIKKAGKLLDVIYKFLKI